MGESMEVKNKKTSTRCFKTIERYFISYVIFEHLYYVIVDYFLLSFIFFNLTIIIWKFSNFLVSRKELIIIIIPLITQVSELVEVEHKLRVVAPVRGRGVPKQELHNLLLVPACHSGLTRITRMRRVVKICLTMLCLKLIVKWCICAIRPPP